MSSRGFIQTYALIAILVGVLVVGSGGYWSLSQYQDSQKEQTVTELTEAQKKEISSLSGENEKLQWGEGLDNASGKIKNDQLLADKSGTKTIELLPPQNTASLQGDYQQSAADLAKLIVRIICSDGDSSKSDESQIIGGSGTIFGRNQFIITNFHVIDGAVSCRIGITDKIKNPPARWYDATVVFGIPSLDIATLRPTQILPDSVSAVAYNPCPSQDIKLGDEIIILGYPTVGGDTITATEGVISGFDGFLLKTSAKIEHGNSGGGAFLKKNGCWFGIPTFVTKGEYESLGSIINYSLIQEQSQ